MGGRYREFESISQGAMSALNSSLRFDDSPCCQPRCLELLGMIEEMAVQLLLKATRDLKDLMGVSSR